MDRHHVAHYALAAAIAVGGGAGLYKVGETPRVTQVVNAAHATRVSEDLWPSLSDLETLKLVDGFKRAGVTELDIFCINSKCDDVADDFVSAARRAGIAATLQRPEVYVAGFSVGAPDHLTASSLANAVAVATGITPKIAVGSFKPAYVAFGNR